MSVVFLIYLLLLATVIHFYLLLFTYSSSFVVSTKSSKKAKWPTTSFLISLSMSSLEFKTFCIVF